MAKKSTVDNTKWAYFGLALVTWHFFGDSILKQFRPPEIKPETVPYTTLRRLAQNHQVSEIIVTGQVAVGEQWDKDKHLKAIYTTRLPQNADVDKLFGDTGAEVTNKEAESGFSKTFWDFANALYGLYCLSSVTKKGPLRKIRNRIFKEKDILADESDVTFEDVAGMDEIKNEVQEVVSLLRGQKSNKKLGVKMPKGLLLAGGPGNGKTLLAKAIAGEADVPFYANSATSFENKYYGESAKQVRDLFEMARKNAPCIIFIDEIDAIGRSRSGDENHWGNDSIVVELLNQMDGFEDLDNVLVIAATNQPQVLDAALLRPGRFDRQIVVPSPDVNGREEILEVHTRNRPIDDDVNLRTIAERTFGFSGADLANLVNEASINAARRPNADTITARDFDVATDRIVMGIERSLHLTDEQKWITAVHEAGHTIIALEKENTTPLHKVTIVPHGQALGVTVMRPEEECYGYKLKELKSQLVMLFGGRVAEEIVLGSKEEVGTGASNDIQKATDIAWNMVTKFGFSELGAVRYGNGVDGYLGPASHHDMDEHTSAKVYEQVKIIVGEAEQETRAILTANKPKLELLAKELLKKETLMAAEVKKLLSQPALFPSN